MFATLDSTSAWQPGQIVAGLYEIQALVGHGGMGAVHRVRHIRWNIDLAVKTPSEQQLRAAGGRERFQEREAYEWVQLGLHPNIVACFYVRTLDDGIPHIFMEYVDGGSLAHWLEQGRLADLDAALDVGIQACWGLAWAHRQGLVHRDVKPANILMTSSGVPKVTDLGLVKPVGEEGDLLQAAHASDPGATVVGGTLGYAAPEQNIRGATVLVTADVYAMGVVLYELLQAALGLPAFPHAMPSARPALYRAELKKHGGTLSDVLLRCMAAEPALRFPDAGALAQALVALYPALAGLPYTREPPSETRIRADGLNNKALSLLDLGKEAGAEEAWQAALQADLYHPEATYNLGLRRWRDGRQPDDDLVAQLKAVMVAHPRDWRACYLLGLVHLERGDGEAAALVLQEAVELAPGEEEAREALARASQAQTARCVRILSGHTGPVRHALLTPDARRALSTSGYELWLWDVALERHVSTMGMRAGEVYHAAITPDGRYAVSSISKWLMLWDLDSGQRVRTLSSQGITGDVAGFVLMPDGRRVLCGTLDRKLRLWDLFSGECLLVLREPNYVRSMAISRDGHLAVSADKENLLHVWNLDQGICLHELSGHTAWIRDIAVTPDGKCAISASEDRTVRLWDLQGGECLAVLEGHQAAVWKVALTPDGRWAVSLSADRTLRVWDLERRECRRVLTGHKADMNALALTPDGCRAVSSSDDNTVRLWDLAGGRCLRTYEGHRYETGSLAVTPDGRFVLAAEKTWPPVEDLYDLRLWGLVGPGEFTGEWMLSRPPLPAQAVQESGAAHAEIKAARAALAQGKVADAGAALRRARDLPGYERDPELLELWHQAGTHGGRRTGLRGIRSLHILQGHEDYVYAVTITPDCRLSISAGRDQALRVWDLATGQCRRVLLGHEIPIGAVAVTPDGRRLVAGDNNGVLRLWDLGSGETVRIMQGHTNPVGAVALTLDGRLLSGSWDRTLRVWDVETGQCLRTLTGHREAVYSVAVTPDGHYAVSGSGDWTLRVWDLQTYACRGVYEEHGDIVNAAAILPDGSTVLSGGGGDSKGLHDSTLHLWSLQTRTRRQTLSGHTGEVRAAAVTPDGRFAISASADNTLRVWSLDTGKCLQVVEGHRSSVNATALASDGRVAVSGGDYTVRVWQLDWDYAFPGVEGWDEGARPYLQAFLANHVPRPSLIERLVRRTGPPAWDSRDLDELMAELRQCGYGFVPAERVRQELDRMAGR